MAKKTPRKKTPRKSPTRRARKPALAYIAEQLRPLAVPLDQLKLNDKNAVTHDQASIDAIAASLKRYTQRQPIVVNENDGVILVGNGRYQAAQALGWTHIAVVWVQDDPAAATGYAIADNRTAEFAHWDDQMLAELLADVHKHDADLFAALDLADLCDGFEEPAAQTKEKAVPETWIVSVEVDGEKEQKKLYDRLIKEGYNVKVQML